MRQAFARREPGILSFRDRREPPIRRAAFDKVRRAEVQYARQLRGIATHVGHIVKGFDPADPSSMSALNAALQSYADLLKPWARATAARMLADVSRRDEKVWAELSLQMSRGLREEIRSAPISAIMHGLLAEQVDLITSLPLEESKRVHEWALKGLENAGRAREAADAIMRSGQVTRGRADLIARTEVARTASVLVQTRAEHVGSDGYIWRTANDADVRPLHRRLAGKFIRWDQPPIAGTKGMRYHAGQGPNCRCYCEPVIPDEL